MNGPFSFTQVQLSISCETVFFALFFNSWEKSLFIPTSLRNAAICAQQNWCNLLFDVPIGYYIYFLKKGEQKIVLVLYFMFNKYFVPFVVVLKMSCLLTFFVIDRQLSTLCKDFSKGFFLCASPWIPLHTGIGWRCS